DVDRTLVVGHERLLEEPPCLRGAVRDEKVARGLGEERALDHEVTARDSGLRRLLRALRGSRHDAQSFSAASIIATTLTVAWKSRAPNMHATCHQMSRASSSERSRSHASDWSMASQARAAWLTLVAKASASAGPTWPQVLQLTVARSCVRSPGSL